VWLPRLVAIFFTGIAFLAPPVLARNLPPPWPMLVMSGLVGALMYVWYRVERPGELRRERKAKGLCVRCGYDLRGTPQRCPECGAPASVSTSG
jgi:hypothetical protein